METDDNIIELATLQTGDILLCVGEGRLASIVAKKTGSVYTHAAICYSPTVVVDIGERVQKTPTNEFITEFRYVAVYRNPTLWNAERKAALCSFLETKVNSETVYDTDAAKGFSERQKQHEMTLFAKLTEHFTDGLPATAHDKTSYICSELVIASLIAVGFWDEAMAISYQGDTLHPGKMGHTSTFGFRVGYLRADPTTEIPSDDEFLCSMTNRMTFATWQANQKQMSEEVPLQTDELLSLEEMHALTEGGRFFQTEPQFAKKEKEGKQ